MRKRFFAFAILMLLGMGSVFAQFQDFERGSNQQRSRSRYRLMDHLRFGGNFGLSFGSEFLNVQFNPNVGYCFNQYVTSGVIATMEYFKGTSYFNETYSNFTYGGGAFVDVFPIDFLVVRAEAQLISYDDCYHNFQNPEKKVEVPILIGAGYHKAITDRASINLMLLWNLNETEGLRNNTTFSNPILKINFCF